MSDLPVEVDVVVVGAGPAGLAAAELLARRGKWVLVLERDTAAGGVPRFCGHSPYGWREFRQAMLGPEYAWRLARAARQAGADIRTGVSVVSLHPGPRLVVTSDAGVAEIRAGAVLLATGVRETSRAARMIGGTKPGGVMNTGALQSVVYGTGVPPFRRPVVVGTELVAFSALLTCRHAEIRPVAMVEAGARVTARWPAARLPRLLGVPLWLNTGVEAIEGRDRVEAVVLRREGRRERVEADGVVLTGGFRPESTLLRTSHLSVDPGTGGPEVDEYGRCSDPGYFAAGNLLRAVETAGHCWSEGRAIGAAMLRALRGELPEGGGTRIAVAPGALKYAVPQRVTGGPEPALTHVQMRVSRAASGRIGLRVNGHESMGRQLCALPERRLRLPLPSRGLNGLRGARALDIVLDEE